MRLDHTSIYEKKLLQQIAAQQRAVSVIFGKFVNKVSPYLANFKDPGNTALWAKNQTLKKVLEKELLVLRRELKTYLLSQTETAWNLSSEKVDNIINDYTKGLAINQVARDGMFARNLDALKSFQKRQVGGLGLSDRIWKISNVAKEQMEFYLSSGVATGTSAATISRDVKQFLNNPDARFRRVRDPQTGKLKLSRPMKNYHPGRGVYRSAYKNALRVTRSETNMAYRYGDIERFRKLDFVIGYEVKLSGSHPEFDICDHMTGKYPKTFTFGGWHPNCYCYMVPILPEQEQFVKYLETGKLGTPPVKGIPPMAARYVRDKTGALSAMENKPYWISNFKKKDGKFVPKSGINKPPAVQGPISKARNNYSPVSDAFDFIAPQVREKFDEALKFINEVHDDGRLPKIPVISISDINASGYFDPVRHRIGISALSRHPELTSIHEIGHFIDFWGIGTQGRMESELSSGILKGVLDAAGRSKSIKHIKHLLSRGKIVYLGEELTLSDEAIQALNYYLMEAEIWARAYAQYIAEKTGNDLLLRQIKSQESFLMNTQWSQEDFSEIKQEIDKLFEQFGWLKKKT